MDGRFEPLPISGETVEIDAIILCFVKDRLTAIPSGHDVIYEPGREDPRAARHVGRSVQRPGHDNLSRNV